MANKFKTVMDFRKKVPIMASMTDIINENDITPMDYSMLISDMIINPPYPVGKMQHRSILETCCESFLNSPKAIEANSKHETYKPYVFIKSPHTGMYFSYDRLYAHTINYKKNVCTDKNLLSAESPIIGKKKPIKKENVNIEIELNVNSHLASLPCKVRTKTEIMFYNMSCLYYAMRSVRLESPKYERKFESRFIDCVRTVITSRLGKMQNENATYHVNHDKLIKEVYYYCKNILNVSYVSNEMDRVSRLKNIDIKWYEYPNIGKDKSDSDYYHLVSLSTFTGGKYELLSSDTMNKLKDTGELFLNDDYMRAYDDMVTFKGALRHEHAVFNGTKMSTNTDLMKSISTLDSSAVGELVSNVSCIIMSHLKNCNNPYEFMGRFDYTHKGARKNACFIIRESGRIVKKTMELFTQNTEQCVLDGQEHEFVTYDGIENVHRISINANDWKSNTNENYGTTDTSYSVNYALNELADILVNECKLSPLEKILLLAKLNNLSRSDCKKLIGTEKDGTYDKVNSRMMRKVLSFLKTDERFAHFSLNRIDLESNNNKSKSIKAIGSGTEFQFESVKKCSDSLGINVSNIRACLSGRRATAGGYSFEYC